MGVTVSSMAGSSRLTSRARVKAELEITASTWDAVFDDLIDQASAAIVSYCNRGFARASYVETLAGFGDIHLQLARTPIVSVSAVADQNSSVITDYAIEDRERGWLYRRAGWLWSAQSYGGLASGGAWLDVGYPLHRQEEPHYSVTYIGGYVLPSQYINAATTISAADSDDSFNDSASGFPANLVAGDVVEASSFTAAADNGRFIVVSATTAKIVVDAALTTEAAGTARTLKFRPHADCKRNLDDVEKAAIECVKSWYLRRKDDSDVAEKQAGPMRVRYSETVGASTVLPPSCVGLLRPWVRAS